MTCVDATQRTLIYIYIYIYICNAISNRIINSSSNSCFRMAIIIRCLGVLHGLIIEMVAFFINKR